MHYMGDTVLKGDELTIENWNKAVDSFDVKGLADQLASAGAGYFVLTLGQNSGYYCAPNAAYDRLTGIAPSKCARRDLVADLSKALRARRIRLMVYLPAGAPDRDKEAMKALEWKPGQFPLWTYMNGKPTGQDDRFAAFQRKWETVIAQWSKQWGTEMYPAGGLTGVTIPTPCTGTPRRLTSRVSLRRRARAIRTASWRSILAS